MPTKEELEKGFTLGDWEVFPGRRELHRGDDKPYRYIDVMVKAGYCLKQPVILNEPREKLVAPVVIETRKASRIWAAVAAVGDCGIDCLDDRCWAQAACYVDCGATV